MATFRSTRVWATCIATLLSLLMLGCGDDDDAGGGGGGSSEPVATVDLTATDFKFDPADPTVDKTGTVRFRVRNEGEFPHAVEVEGPSGEAETEQVPPGQSATVDVDLSEEGSFEFYCPVDGHKDKGMTGEVSVGGGGGSSGGGDTSEDSGGSRGY